MKCPYCGAEMELRRSETAHNERDESWMCRTCDHFVFRTVTLE